MENPQPDESRTITTIDAVNLLYYAAIGVAPQTEKVKDGLRNAIIGELSSLVQEREQLRQRVLKLEPTPVLENALQEHPPVIYEMV